MITLKLHSGSPKEFESTIYSHPVLTGANYVDYTLNHNFGVEPDLTRMFAVLSGEWREYFDIFGWSSSAHINGFRHDYSSDPENVTVVRVYRIDGIAANIRFKLFKF